MPDRDKTVAVVGAGLAGCECARVLARAGVPVVLFEQKPGKRSPAHVADTFSELVCSNSLRSDELASGIGLIKQELRDLESPFMAAADACRVPAGKALAVDREKFSRRITDEILAEPGISLEEREIDGLDDPVLDGFAYVVIAAGPLASEDLSAKKALALEVIARLKKEYPDAACTLDYDHAWQLLVSVRLAAQCTDARVNIVVEDLFAKYPSVAALAAAEPEEIEAIVKPCGLGHSKARDISACMRMLRDKYDCKVPTTFEELLSLPGVGRKSANLIMGDVFGKPAIVTDTHCIRLCNKIGLVDGIKEPQKVEMALWKIIPPEEGSDLCHRFVMHGRAVCNARKPECEKCCLRAICRYARENAAT